MSRHDTIGKTATTVRRSDDGSVHCTYHQTTVVTLRADGVVVLRTGGWRTATTKARMNQASRAWRLGFGVYQKAGEWFVENDGGEPVKFEGREMRRDAARRWLPGCPE